MTVGTWTVTNHGDHRCHPITLCPVEVTSLTNHRADLGDAAIRTVLLARSDAYRAAVDPGVAALRTFLQNNWQITL